MNNYLSIKSKDFIIKKAHFHERSYSIVYGKSIYKKIDLFLKDLELNRKTLIISEQKLKDLYGKELEQSLKKVCKSVDWILLTGKESDKNLDNIHKLYEQSAKLKLDKSSIVIALGGGVIQDTVNYFAATYNRGITFIQIPTTALSQVDVGFGGCAVDHEFGKSLVGQFYQPKLILIDKEFLHSLPPYLISDGLSEIINKVLCIGGLKVKNIEKDIEKIINGDLELLSKYVELSNKVKLKLIESDETGLLHKRLFLDWGHTLTHAIEKTTNYQIPHGVALGIGMIFAAEVSEKQGLLHKNKVILLKKIIEKAKLPSLLPKDINIQDLLNNMNLDQKMFNNQLKLVLLKDFGKPILSKEISLNDIEKYLANQVSNSISIKDLIRS